MFQDILNCQVRLYSLDGENSDIVDYLNHLIDTNPEMAKKAISAISNLPYKIFTNSDIKPIKVSKIKFYELRVKSSSNICRFFFTIEKPNIIVLHGFTKKTQKTSDKDLSAGIKAYTGYLQNRETILFDI